MKKKNNNKLIAIVGISIAAMTAVAAGSTLAYFAINKDVNQAIYPNGGEMKKSIFLDCESIWNHGYDELYYAYVWKSGTETASAHKAGTEGYLVPAKNAELDLNIKEENSSSYSVFRTIHVFEFDSISFDRIIFTRMNPSSVSIDISSDLSSWWNEGSDGSYLWGLTPTITYNSSYNYYRINDYRTDSKTSKYSYGVIDNEGNISIKGHID